LKNASSAALTLQLVAFSSRCASVALLERFSQQHNHEERRGGKLTMLL
jgi:hypothetical protein